MYAGLQQQQPLPQASEDKYVALVSGLGMGDEGGETARVALLVDYLAGLLGGPKEHEQVAKVHEIQTFHLSLSCAALDGLLRSMRSCWLACKSSCFASCSRGMLLGSRVNRH